MQIEHTEALLFSRQELCRNSAKVTGCLNLLAEAEMVQILLRHRKKTYLYTAGQQEKMEIRTLRF